MTKLVFAAAVAVAWATSVAPGAAQQRLRMKVQDVIGSIALAQAGYGCFDPLAGIRFDKDILASEISEATQKAFSVGSCVAMPANVSLIGVTRISLEGQTFVRGDIADTGITAYLPDWSAALAGVDDGYDLEKMELASPVIETADWLRARVAAFQICDGESEALEERILAFNERAQAANPRKRRSSGSRLGEGADSMPVFQVILPDEKYRALYDEAQALQADVEAFWSRCGEYQSAIMLDQDYLAFIEATE